MAKKMTAEEMNEILRKDGTLNESLSIFPDDNSAAIISLRMAETAAEPMEEDDGEGEYFYDWSTGQSVRRSD